MMNKEELKQLLLRYRRSSQKAYDKKYGYIIDVDSAEVCDEIWQELAVFGFCFEDEEQFDRFLSCECPDDEAESIADALADFNFDEMS